MTIKNVQSYIVHVRGAGQDVEEANERALVRLSAATRALVNGEVPVDAGISIRTVDPGGGGGPCAPEFISVEVDVSASGLPEAQSRDD